MIANYLEQRWFRWLLSAMAFIPPLVFEFYRMPWLSVAYVAVFIFAAIFLTRG